MKVFIKVFCETLQAGVIIFGKQVNNDVLYRGIVNQPSHSFSFLLCPITLNNEIS